MKYVMALIALIAMVLTTGAITTSSNGYSFSIVEQYEDQYMVVDPSVNDKGVVTLEFANPDTTATVKVNPPTAVKDTKLETKRQYLIDSTKEEGYTGEVYTSSGRIYFKGSGMAGPYYKGIIALSEGSHAWFILEGPDASRLFESMRVEAIAQKPQEWIDGAEMEQGTWSDAGGISVTDGYQTGELYINCGPDGCPEDMTQNWSPVDENGQMI
jgi:hypothetical protein